VAATFAYFPRPAQTPCSRPGGRCASGTAIATSPGSIEAPSWPWLPEPSRSLAQHCALRHHRPRPARACLRRIRRRMPWSPWVAHSYAEQVDQDLLVVAYPTGPPTATRWRCPLGRLRPRGVHPEELVFHADRAHLGREVQRVAVAGFGPGSLQVVFRPIWAATAV
jgi:hypothetical protein